jgi:hypothetical protein
VRIAFTRPYLDTGGSVIAGSTVCYARGARFIVA